MAGTPTAVDKGLSFAFGVTFVATMLALVLGVPHLTPTQWFVFASFSHSRPRESERSFQVCLRSAYRQRCARAALLRYSCLFIGSAGNGFRAASTASDSADNARKRKPGHRVGRQRDHRNFTRRRVTEGA